MTMKLGKNLNSELLGTDLQHGFLEKVYTYEVSDSLIIEETVNPGDIVPIKDISILILPKGTSGVELDI